ncbi:MAG TPA: 4-(cytidine 5'-diphospho)-2-C-methyl-D-erythritol kinase [Puia sp.]|jgi:4-diphosphocytidyl-2-C-methyl-D-erythritol kinase|nr:4-(cytidine 5'-diphospho)-2-C-methyl-D-erythritol kinase [Puia sp.]
MVSFPNCKINLGLKILRRREDGFHDLETIFYPLPLADILEAVRAPELQFTVTGRPIPGDPGANLTIRAWQLLRQDFPDLPFIHIHLHKRIPIGGGLGGGSADGAFMLELLNRKFRLGLDAALLARYAAQLGSDCPFFLLNQPCLGQGRGERLEPLPLDLSAYSFLLVHPGIHVSTADAFSRCRPNDSGPSLRSVITRPIELWRDTLINDFEAAIFTGYPILREIRQSLYDQGALYAAMTGSGSCLYGIFEAGRAEAAGWSSAFEVISIPAKK